MPKQKLKRLPSDLTDKEWSILAPLMPPKARTGRPRNDDRKTINGILYVLSTGCRWEDLPAERYGSGKTCWYRFKDWREQGIWNAIAGTLLLKLNRRRKINLTNAYLDTSVRQNKRGLLIRLATRATRGKLA
jgi:transposase